MKHDFKFFVKEGAGNMFSHGFMSFAAIGVTVACLLIMGTFTLVAYNANENLADLQRENAIVAFVDETLDEDQARALQSQVEAVANVADCSFVTRTEARDAYVAKYDAEGVYGDLLPEVFRHRYVIHVTDPDHIMDTKEAVEQVPGIAKARADEAVANGFVTVRNVAGVISIALIARLLLGTLSAAVAFGLQWLLYLAVAKGIASSDSLQILHIVPFTDIWYIVALVFLAAGILVGVGGSLTAIRRFLRV